MQIGADQLVLQRTRFSAEGRDEGPFTMHTETGVTVAQRLSGAHLCSRGVVEFE